ncbi:unnamed protein product [Heterobilharzia americana]|nr:unnamed protein product [Heterobilharzia americana]
MDDENKFLTDTLVENGYPLQFVNHCKKQLTPKPTVSSVPKKSIFLKVPYRGETSSMILKQRLKSVISKTYYAAQLIIVETTKHLLHHKPQPRTNDYITSNCVYQFTCMCGHTYIGRSNRSMQTRVGEHIPKWLEKQFNTQTLISAGDRHPSSSIAKHIIEMNHKVNTKTAFKIIYRNNQGRILKFAEALAIRKLNPPLCVQKQFVVSLNLPW